MTHVTEDGRHWVNADYPRSQVSEDELNGMVELRVLKRLVESLDRISRIGIKRARKAIAENTLNASYYQPSSGSYFRYGHNSLYVVRDGEWKEIYGGMDSNTLIHTDGLKQAIKDHDSIYPDLRIDDMGDDSNLQHHLSPFCEVRDV
ncbi:hypothetical protein NLV80_002718 [Acinetobacter baumannii]|nr:hypothetical protein [Acinetobacter baumannii]EKT9847478.1 hypothetical protein [Acinetobacter baumannii]